MEDDDEFGDLYTDILVPPPQLAPSASTAPSKPASTYESESTRPPAAPVAPAAPAAAADSRGFNWEEDDVAGDDNGVGLARVSGIGGDFDEPMIPGLSVAPTPAPGPEPMNYDDGGDEDSDSEDDLQIVLNDNTIPMDRRGMRGMEEDDDEDDLVIVTGDDMNMGLPMEAQDGGNEAAAGDGERKDGADVGKVAGAVGGRIGYSGHAYNPHQYKYVRQGVSGTSGNAANSGSAFNQGSAPGTVGLVAGRGRGDWRPTGKGTPSLPRSYHPGFNASWGSAARSLGSGMDFTLPSHKTVFEVDIDIFEEKPWKMHGVDITDFFNFDLDEDGWRRYCKQLEQYRLETTMQSKIRVYESGRSEQDYDPDLPPELAAATGLHDGSAENSSFVKVDGGQVDLSGQERSATRLLPTGRAIPVETGYGERLPSIDMRPPRNRDLDVIIEIELHDDADDNPVASNGALEPPADVSQVENFKGGHDDGDEDHVSSPYGDTQREADKSILNGGSKHKLDEDYNTVSGPGDVHLSLDGREASEDQTSSYDEKRLSQQGSKRDASLLETEAMKELSGELNTDGFDDSLALGESIEGEGEDLTSDFEVGVSGNDEDNKLANSVEKSKLSSRGGLSAHEMANGYEMNPSTSDNSKHESGNSRRYHNLRGGEEDAMQDGRSRISKIRRMGDDEKPGNVRDNYYRDRRKGKERSHSATRGREDITNPLLHRDYGVSPGHYSRPKVENLERQERDASVRNWQRNEGRKRKIEEIRTRDVPEERSVRQRSKFQENDRLKEDYQYMRKRVDDVNWHNRHEKDLGSRFRERDAALMGRHEVVDDLILRRRNDDEIVMRDHEKLESFHGYRGREDRRKHERSEMVDVRRRDDQSKLRPKTDEIIHSARKREESWKHKTKEEDKIRLKQSREGDKLPGAGRNKEEPKSFASDKEYSRRDKRKREGDDELTLPYRKQERTNSRETQAKAADRNPRHERSGRQNNLINKEIRKPHGRQGNKGRGGGELNSAKLDKKEQDDHRREKVELKIASKVDEESMNCNGDDCPKPFSTGSSSKFHRSDQDKLDMPSSEQEDATSDDESHRKSKRGRSKLERWESNKEIDANDNFGSSKALNEIEEKSSNKPVENDLPNNANEVINGNNVGGSDSQTFEPEKNDNDPHSDTVAKLRKRSERFKLPMPGDKDTSASRKLEAERVAAQNESANESPEIKPERPARKRRWITA